MGAVVVTLALENATPLLTSSAHFYRYAISNQLLCHSNHVLGAYWRPNAITCQINAIVHQKNSYFLTITIQLSCQPKRIPSYVCAIVGLLIQYQ